MTGPQHPAAAGGDRLRAGHADREQVIETLKTAFVHGRLTRNELGERAGRALTARTCAELAALTAGIPPGPAGAGPGRPRPPPAAGQGGRQVGRLPGHRGRRHAARRARRSGRPRPQSLSFLGCPVRSPGPCRRSHGTRHRETRGGRLAGAKTLPRAAAAPAGAGRPRPGSRTLPRHRPWPGSPRPPHRPDPRRPAGSQLTAAPAAHPRTGGPGTPWRQTGARRGMTPVKPAPPTPPPRLSRLGLTSLAHARFPRATWQETGSQRTRGTRAPQA